VDLNQEWPIDGGFQPTGGGVLGRPTWLEYYVPKELNLNTEIQSTGRPKRRAKTRTVTGG